MKVTTVGSDVHHMVSAVGGTEKLIGHVY